MTTSTLGVELRISRITSDVDEFTSVERGETDADQNIEDGLAMQREIEMYRHQESDTFIRLEDFLRDLET